MLTKVLVAALAAVGAQAGPHRIRSPKAHMEERELHTFQKRFTGTATFYSVGVDLGHCGEMHYDNEFVVALNTAQFRNQGYPGPDCFRQVSITNTETGISQSATIVDSCPTCSYGDLDLSPSLFEALGAPHSKGVFQISWNFGGGGGGENPKPTTKEEPKPTSTWTPEPETSTWTPPPEPSTSTWTPPPSTTSTSTWSPPPEPSSSSESPSPSPSPSSSSSSSNSPSPSSSASSSAAPSSSSSSLSSSSASSSASALPSGLFLNGTLPADSPQNLTSSSTSASSTLTNSTVASAAATASAHAIITNPNVESEDGNLAGVAAVVAQLGQIVITAAGK